MMHKIYIILMCSSIYLLTMPNAFAEDIANCNFSNLAKKSTTKTINTTKGYYIEEDVADKHQLSECLKGKHSSAFHLFAHGKAGQLLIEGNWLSANQIVKWLNTKKLLDNKSQLNIYGCNFAKGEKGKAAVSYLEMALGITIAASDDITGQNGDWILENNSIDMTAVFAGYRHSLQDTLIHETLVVSDSYVVLADTTLVFQIKGGEGGDGTTTTAGQGATATAVFDVTAGDVIRYLVAEGGRGGSEGGGGGSTGIYINSTLVMVAGGGAGGDNSGGAVGLGANSTPDGISGTGTDAGAGGTSGAGGGANPSGGGGGGGITSAGANGAAGANGGGGMADLVGYTLAAGGTSAGGDGGRGLTGGGGSVTFYAAGGGGYSGGGSGGAGGSGGGSAGGGGSYVNTTHPGYISSTITKGANGAGSGGVQANGENGYVLIIEPLDSDGDGVIDPLDLDDDNDGILDADEGLCAQSGAWTLSNFGYAAEYDFGNGVIAQVVSGSATAFTTPNFNGSGAGFWSEALEGDVSLAGEFVNGESITINFVDASGNPVVVNNPILNLDRIGGTNGSTALSAQVALQGGLTWTALAGTDDFLYTSTTVEDLSASLGTSAFTPPWTSESTQDEPLGTAAGTVQINGAVSSFTLSFSILNGSSADGIGFILQACFDQDTDGDGIADYLDLDSDNDECPDYVEGGGTLTETDNGMVLPAGSNLMDGNGDMVTTNLGTMVDTDAMSASYGVPTSAGTGQAVGSSQNAAIDGCLDSDGDGIGDAVDLDDDNDGILDVDEQDCTAITFGNSTVTSGDFASEIFWLSWAGTDLADGINNGDMAIISLPDGGTITGVISNVEDLNITDAATYGADNGNGPADYYLSDFNTFSGALLQSDYNLTDASIFANVGGPGDNNDIRFDIAFTAVSADGIAYSPDIIFSDTEESNNLPFPFEEFQRVETDGEAWELIESVSGTGYNIAGVNTNIAEYNNTGAGVPVLRSNNVSNITVTINAAGQGEIGGQGFAFGVYLECVPIDTDNDGIADHLDLDSDNDDCPDYVEGDGTHTESIGEPAEGDLSDGNGGLVNTNLGNMVVTTPGATLGVPTVAGAGQLIGTSQDSTDNSACSLDTDGDGVADVNDIDSDNDGIPDDVEQATASNGGDTDGDGIPDYLDLDSDNDGIPDLVEAGGTDADGDGIVDDACADSSCDADGDGLMDSVDAVDDTANANPTIGTAGTTLPITDTDGDGSPDFQDLDSDNDGINDIVEAGITDGNNDGIVDEVNPDGTLSNDADGDGFVDSLDPNDNTTPGTGDGPGTPVTPVDTDGDGFPDYQDLDSDNDGIHDIVESGNGAADTDGDGVADNPLTDTDGDGIPDSVDDDPSNFGDAGGTDPQDTDMDNVPDYRDLDSDDDGVLDIVESGNDAADSDGDGVADGVDTDGDGIPDALDEDPSNFGDAGDAGTTDDPSDPLDPNSGGSGVVSDSGTDADGDGIADSVDTNDTDFGMSPDTDGDGVPDADDIDSDNDGIPDDVEIATASNGGDTDGDGIPDYLDLDSDNDGITDLVEAGGTDADGDGIVDDACADSSCDADGDGLMDSVDAVDDTANANPTIGTAGTTLPITDTDGDGSPDFQDLDSDNDGINDIVEAGITDTNNDGIVDDVNPDGTLSNDADGDGFADSLDPNDNLTLGTGDGPGTPVAPADTDGDGFPDYQDLDADNDGINDIVESGNGAADTDGDGVADNPLTDTDGDGIPDSVDDDPSNFGDAGGTDPQDTDNDGIPDHQDLDADNDGILDITESGNDAADTDGDGVADGVDTDGDGIPDSIDDNDGTFGDAGDAGTGDDTSDPLDPNSGGSGVLAGPDADDDGIVDSVDTDDTNFGMATDTDGDGVPDADDIDSDNDGIPDDVEIATASNGGDTDGDGIPDYLDLDSDNDGIPDLVEAGGTDADGDGVVDDACNVPATCDIDGDGLMDSVDAVDDSGNANPTIGTAGTELPITDTDGDGNPDFQDLDSDNDGINDIVEAGIPDTNNDGIVDDVNPDGTLSNDADGDGFADSLDPNDNLTPGTGDGPGTPVTPADTDGDGFPDYQDLDSDNDGIHDIVESGNGAADTDGDGVADNPLTDTDGDGIPDSVDDDPSNFGDAGGTDPQDTDMDNVPDYRDLDADNDGVLDIVESGNDAADSDGDGVADGVDTDGDGIPDALDEDPSNFGDAGDAGTTDDPSDPLNPNSGGSGVLSGPDADDDGIIDSVDTNDSGFGMSPCGVATLEYAITDGANNTTGYIWDDAAVPAGDVPSNASSGTSRSTVYCESGGWRHYYNTNEPDKMLFSIEMGANTTEIDFIDIRVDGNPASRYDTIATNAMFALSRDWNVQTVGGAALTAPVNVRFYYPPSELKQMLDAAIALANTDPTATAPTAADIVWFKSNNFDPGADINPDGTTLAGSAGYTSLTPKVVATANGNSEADGSDLGGGINYVQFDGISGFSGGTAYVLVTGTVLPVELVSFSGKEVDCTVLLEWRSASEENFSHYELERSNDGRNFSTIKIVNGSGNASVQNAYQFTDDLFNNLNYYRLKMVDLDGSFEYSQIVPIRTTCDDFDFSIYPNPIEQGYGSLVVEFLSSKEETKLEILDMLGRIVKRASFETIPETNNRVTIDVSDLPTGTFLVRFNRYSKAHKFVISK